MGRPIKSKYFGPATPGGLQLACEAWVDGDTQSRSGYIISQNSTSSYWVQTSHGKGLCWLSDAVDQAGKMRIQIVAEGFSGMSYARKITDGDMYTWDGKYFPQWAPVNGQMVYGTVDTGTSWIASYGDFEADSNYTAGNGVAYDTDGNIIVVGSYGLHNQPVIMKMSPAGEIIWQKTCTGFTSGEAVITDSDNNIYVAVEDAYYDYNGGCIKLSSAGELIWARKIVDFDTPSDIAIRSDRSIALANRDGWIAWLNPDGTVKFVLNFNTTDPWADFASVEFVGDNLAVATPYVNYTGDYEEGVHLMLLDPTGAKIWETAYRCPNDNVRDWATYMDVDSSNNIYVETRWSRYDAEFDTYTYAGWCAKFNSSGEIQWQIDIVDSGDFEPFTMRVTPDGTSYICGSDDDGGLSFAKINTDGTLAWGKKLLTQSYMDVSWSQGNRDIDIFGNRFIMTGYQGLVDKSQDYMFVLSLPTDGTGDGTYGIYTYQDADMQAITAAWLSAEISYPFVDPEVGNEIPEVTISDINYALELTAIS